MVRSGPPPAEASSAWRASWAMESASIRGPNGLVSGSPAARARRMWTADSMSVVVVTTCALRRPRWTRACSSGSAAARSGGMAARRVASSGRTAAMTSSLIFVPTIRPCFRTGRRREQRVYSRVAGFRQSTRRRSAGYRPRLAGALARTCETRGAPTAVTPRAIGNAPRINHDPADACSQPSDAQGSGRGRWARRLRLAIRILVSGGSGPFAALPVPGYT